MTRKGPKAQVALVVVVVAAAGPRHLRPCGASWKAAAAQVALTMAGAPQTDLFSPNFFIPNLAAPDVFPKCFFQNLEG